MNSNVMPSRVQMEPTLLQQLVAEVKETAKKEAKAESESTKKAVKNIQAKVEKTTLGDLSALAEIKAKLQEGEGDKQ